jgi:Holliday junction resolvase
MVRHGTEINNPQKRKQSIRKNGNNEPAETQMTNPQKRKGDAAERELAKQLEALLGFKVRRKLGAGRQDDTGDIDGLPDCTAQAKNYADILRAINQGLKDTATQQQNADTTHAVLFVRRRGGQWIAIQTLEQWTTTYRETL